MIAAALAILGVFALAVSLQELLGQTGFYRAWYARHPFWVPEGFKTTLQIVLVLLATHLLYRRGARGTAEALGLARPLRPALGLALVSTAPLVGALAVAHRPQAAALSAEVFYTAFYSSFAEDLVYIGFAVRGLHRRAGWPLWLAVLAVALVFALRHVWRGRTVPAALGIFAITGAGLALFSWAFMAWGENLWVPVTLHALIDFWWALFGGGETALTAGALPLAGLVASGAVALVLTLRRQRRARPPTHAPSE
jgi:membrane protease YdiL (CAAX protease family)